MSVFQIEEYYIHIDFGFELNEKTREIIEKKLCDENIYKYEYQDDNRVIIIDDFSDESEAESIEKEITEIARSQSERNKTNNIE